MMYMVCIAMDLWVRVRDGECNLGIPKVHDLLHDMCTACCFMFEIDTTVYPVNHIIEDIAALCPV